MKTILALTIASQFAAAAAVASTSSLFNELEAAMQTYDNSAQEQTEFERYKAQHLQEFNDYVETHFAEFDAFRDQLIQQWGEAKVSDQSQFVSYSEDNRERLEVDFENNEIVLSVRHHAGSHVSDEQVSQAIERFKQSEDELFRSFLSGGALDDGVSERKQVAIDNGLRVKSIIAAKAQIKQQTQEQKKLAEQQADEALALESDPQVVEAASKQLTTKKAELDQLATKRIKNLTKSVKQISKTEPQQVTQVRIKMPKNGLAHKRAAQYQGQIAKQSERFEIEPSLVLAVMHTESHFNPLAKSHIPAFGLMQIVPTSAGVDVNRFLHKLDEPMSPPYLYVVDNNIEAGTAYLHLLNDRYLSAIKDPLSRKYCMIAAYNTGAGNVASVFNADGSRNIKRAARVINSLSPERVLEALQQGLPYNETRRYLKKVLATEKLYI
ncbi:transglycosylase SLT domain-containing protein [Pseudoalteromonas rubra]|uniref:Lytic transglycosylase n=1 Tax=Pseudoalteromonas rubra TaxID=43658 RepID=A0A0F4QI92_9GAMM|nr:transglycosylase SLT domain-containing protein [Pseudoalteromonas rubra]KJZ07356.1 lytic transglycosylase [Pseudoalteromonas rubra]